MKSFEERFVALYEDGQITVNCDDAEALLKEARGTLTYYVDNVPDGKMVRVTKGDDEENGNEYLDPGDIGFYTWKVGEEREDGFFLVYDEDTQQWCYVEYDDLEECEFELIVDETVEIDT